MPPRLPSTLLRCQRLCISAQQQHTYATAATGAVAAALAQLQVSNKHPATQPPSLKPADARKTQLVRQYASLLQSTPLMLLFQHNNLASQEWIGLRRELYSALERVDKEIAASGSDQTPLADLVKLQVVQTRLLGTALRLTEYYDPAANPSENKHVLSREAYNVIAKKTNHPLKPLLAGPIALLTFPHLSPQHLKAALSVLSPSPPNFPAPLRRTNPGWHELPVQFGLQKLMLLGARVEERVFDVDGARWVGTLGGGLDVMRAQVVAALQSIGAGLTNTIDGAGRSIYFTLEGRKMMLEDETKGEGTAAETNDS